MIWYMALAWWLVPCLPFPGLLHIYFLFTVRLTNERMGVFLARRSLQHLVFFFLYLRSPKGEGGILLYLCPSVQDIFRRIFLSNCWWQKSDIWSQASYRYTILWVAFLDPSDSYFLFADLVGLYTHWTYMDIFRHIFLSNYWWQKSDIWSQASYRYPISWEGFWTHQIPTSCLPTWLVFIHIEHICGGIISEH
jgi:hypothetical protein